MKNTRITGLRAFLCGFGLFACTAIGCQSRIAGQTMPSGNYLRDDVQYHTSGPEMPLSNQRRAIEENRAGRQGDPGGPGGAGVPPAPMQ